MIAILLLLFQLVAPPGNLTATVDAPPAPSSVCEPDWHGMQPYWVTPLVYVCWAPPLCPAGQYAVEVYLSPGVRRDAPACISQAQGQQYSWDQLISLISTGTLP